MYSSGLSFPFIAHPGIVSRTEGSGSISCLLTGGASDKELLQVGLALSLSNDVLELLDDIGPISVPDSATVCGTDITDALRGTATECIRPVA